MKSLVFALLMGAVLLTGQIALAQRDAASKITGAAYEAPYFYSSAGTYQSNAYGHARVLQESASYGEAVPQEVATEHVTAVRKNLAESQKHYAKLRESLQGNDAALKHLDAIDTHHKAALAQAGELEAHVAKGPGDAAAVHKSSAALAESLKSAQGEHEKLMKHARAKKAPPKTTEAKP